MRCRLRAWNDCFLLLSPSVANALHLPLQHEVEPQTTRATLSDANKSPRTAVYQERTVLSTVADVIPRPCHIAKGDIHSHRVSNIAANSPTHSLVSGSRDPLVHWQTSTTGVPMLWPSSASIARSGGRVDGAPMTCRVATLHTSRTFRSITRVTDVYRPRFGSHHDIRRNASTSLPPIAGSNACRCTQDPPLHQPAIPISSRICDGPTSGWAHVGTMGYTDEGDTCTSSWVRR